MRRKRLAVTRAWPEEEKDREPELDCYVTSLGHGEVSGQALLDIVRGHWSTIENGIHHIRDASLGEDRSRIAHPTAAVETALTTTQEPRRAPCDCGGILSR